MLTPASRSLIELALEEDLGRGDVTTEALKLCDQNCTAFVVARQSLTVFGLEIAAAVFRRVDTSLDVAMLCDEGAQVVSLERVLSVQGNAASILQAERTALNFMQRLSGVASLSQAFAKKVQDTDAKVVDTRKTTPGYRSLEKAAVRAGGCYNHRADLASGILLKDNHIAAYGSVAQAVRKALKHAPHALRVEVEVDSLAQLDEAIAAKAHTVLLDNMSVQEVQEAAKRAHAAGLLVEVSGGVTLETVREYALAGADIISSGALTHSAIAVDLGLDFA